MTEFIARFLSLESGELLFGKSGSFCLNNLRVYREMESNNPKRDPNENICMFSDAITENLTPSLVSCWTLLGSKNIATDDWGNFPFNDAVMAIVSTIDDVEVLLKKLVSGVLKRVDLTHGRVEYLDTKHMQKPDNHDILGNAFIKDLFFRKEKEYRFLISVTEGHFLKSLVFYTNLPYSNPDYSFIQSIRINPTFLADQNRAEDFEKLKKLFLEANVESKIIDFDELYSPKCRRHEEGC